MQRQKSYYHFCHFSQCCVIFVICPLEYLLSLIRGVVDVDELPKIKLTIEYVKDWSIQYSYLNLREFRWVWGNSGVGLRKLRWVWGNSGVSLRKLRRVWGNSDVSSRKVLWVWGRWIGCFCFWIHSSTKQKSLLIQTINIGITNRTFTYNPYTNWFTISRQCSDIILPKLWK